MMTALGVEEADRPPCLSHVSSRCQLGVVGGVRGAYARMAEVNLLHPWRVSGGACRVPWLML